MNNLRSPKALTDARDKRPVYYRFAAAQSINASAAKCIGLPTSLVDRRQRGSSMYCTQQYFDFIRFVESVYLANLLLEMMVAYNDGNIIWKNCPITVTLLLCKLMDNHQTCSP
jgi:hypothetical protein